LLGMTRMKKRDRPVDHGFSPAQQGQLFYFQRKRKQRSQVTKLKGTSDHIFYPFSLTFQHFSNKMVKRGKNSNITETFSCYYRRYQLKRSSGL